MVIEDVLVDIDYRKMPSAFFLIAATKPKMCRIQFDCLRVIGVAELSKNIMVLHAATKSPEAAARVVLGGCRWKCHLIFKARQPRLIATENSRRHENALTYLVAQNKQTGSKSSWPQSMKHLKTVDVLVLSVRDQGPCHYMSLGLRVDAISRTRS